MNGTPQIRIYSVIVGLGLLILFAFFRFPASDTSSSTHGSGRSLATNIAQQSRPSRPFIRTNKGIRMNPFGGLGAAMAASSLEGARRGGREILSDENILVARRKLASDMGPVKGRRLTNLLTNELSQ